MNDHLDLADWLDAAIPGGPDPYDADRTRALVAAGRRARTRRRAAVGAAAAAVVVLVGGVALGTAAGGQRAGGDPAVATDPPGPRPTTSPAGDPQGALVPGDRVGLSLDGRLVVREGVEVLHRVANPLGSTPPAHSLGLAVRDGATTYWYLLDTDGRHGSGSLSDVARRAFPTLRSWLDDQVALQTGRPTLALVRLAPGGTLVPLAGVTLVQQRSGVRLGNDFAPPGATTAVAQVRWRGRPWFVAVRQLPGAGPEYLPTAGSVAGPTLDDFLAYARTRYSEGGAGLR